MFFDARRGWSQAAHLPKELRIRFMEKLTKMGNDSDSIDNQHLWEVMG